MFLADLMHPHVPLPKQQYDMLDPELRNYKWAIRIGNESNYMRLQILLNLYGFPFDNPFENYADVEWYPYINYSSTFDTFGNVVFASVSRDATCEFFETVEELAKSFEKRVH